MHRFTFLEVVASSVTLFCAAEGFSRADNQSRGGAVEMRVEKTSFGSKDGQPVTLFTCTNKNGLVLKMIDYGAIVVSLEVPDRNGHIENVNLGFDRLDGYLERHPYFGSTVGRYCNRIAQGKFSLDGKQYTLATNDGPNHLHGGDNGFDRVLWNSKSVERDNEVGVEFTYLSKDQEEGYPGNLTASARYTLTNENELKVVFRATTDKATPVNLTNHCYWNLAGAKSGKKILDHEVMIAADKYLAVDDTLIPTGELASVAGSPMDFTEPTKIGARIQQVRGVKVGYDHCFVLRPRDTLALAARVHDPASGRIMEIHTTQPAIQFYTGNFLEGKPSEAGHPQHGAFCLETQHLPDSPNHAIFPSTILRPGIVYEHTTVHRFMAR